MKVYMLIICLGFLLGLSSCATTHPNTDTDQNPKMQRHYENLVERLHEKGGMEILGTGDNVRILIRGMNSITNDTRPLFVVNGSRIGRDYKEVNDMLNPNAIKSIRVLKGLSETSVYGNDGRNGVILIKTLKS